jgi:hypothetical protein
MAKIKGYSLLSSRTVVETRYGQAALQKVIDALPPADRAIFSNPILSHAFYPLEAYVHWLETELRVLYDGDVSIINQQFLEATEKAMNGVYSMMQRFKSPMAAVHGMAVFHHFEDVSVDRVELGPNRVLFVYRGFRKQHAMYEMVLRNWWFAVVRLTGGKDVRFEPKTPIAAGKDLAEYVISWT